LRKFILPIIAILLLTSCSSEHIYDKVGFEPGRVPENGSDPRINRTAPDYYYRAAPTVPQGYAPQPVYYAPPPAYAYPQQTYQQPAYAPQPVPYQQPAPASRYYSNPYAIPATPYVPAYDTDQYYVAPNAYYGAEQVQGGRDGPSMRY